MLKIIYVKIRMKDPFKTAGDRQGSRESFLTMEDEKSPYIPATHFKGVLRHELEKLSMDEFVSKYLGSGGAESKEKYRETLVKFMDLIPAETWNQSIRPKIAIEESSGKAKSGHLKFERVVDRGAEFHGVILLKEADENIEKVIHGGILSMADFGIGGSRSAGMGRFDLEDFVVLEGDDAVRKIKEIYLSEVGE